MPAHTQPWLPAQHLVITRIMVLIGSQEHGSFNYTGCGRVSLLKLADAAQVRLRAGSVNHKKNRRKATVAAFSWRTPATPWAGALQRERTLAELPTCGRNSVALVRTGFVVHFSGGPAAVSKLLNPVPQGSDDEELLACAAEATCRSF